MSIVRIALHPHRDTRCYLYSYRTIQEILVKKNWMGQFWPVCTVPGGEICFEHILNWKSNETRTRKEIIKRDKSRLWTRWYGSFSPKTILLAIISITYAVIIKWYFLAGRCRIMLDLSKLNNGFRMITNILRLWRNIAHHTSTFFHIFLPQLQQKIKDINAFFTIIMHFRMSKITNLIWVPQRNRWISQNSPPHFHAEYWWALLMQILSYSREDKTPHIILTISSYFTSLGIVLCAFEIEFRHLPTSPLHGKSAMIATTSTSSGSHTGILTPDSVYSGCSANSDTKLSPFCGTCD